MNKENEQYLWDGRGEFPRTVISEMLDKGMIESVKQAWRTLEKWAEKGIYTYGVTLDLGWKQ